MQQQWTKSKGQWGVGALVVASLLLGSAAMAADSSATADKAKAPVAPEFKAEQSLTTHAITLNGKAVTYQAEAGTLLVTPKDPLDATESKEGDKDDKPEALMSYVAYTLGKETDSKRPIMFVFNGGPGSASIWLHMGSFGPKRVDIPSDRAAGAAPYALVDNAETVLPATDLVFVDAPGTGFGHLKGKGADRLFLGIDGDAHTMARFILQYCESHQRFNSPKFIFGESYGTTRAAVVSNLLASQYSVAINGVVMLSQILVWDNNADSPQTNPGVDQAYVLSLPTYAATAWYHHKVQSNAASLREFLKEVEAFALKDYAYALAQGRRLDPKARADMASRLERYTGLSAALWEQADLRVNVGVFTQNVLGRSFNAGRLDTRFSGLSLDPLAKESQYDPQSSAISSAYVSLFNDYVRRELKFGMGKEYHASADFGDRFDLLHRPPGEYERLPQSANVAIDLTHAMIENPTLRVMLNVGYFDLATPYFAANFELDHLPITGDYLSRIDRFYYPSGHMIYVVPEERVHLTQNLLNFIQNAAGSNSAAH